MDGRNYDLPLDVSTNVDLCTPSPITSFDLDPENPMNELFNCIEMKEKLASQENPSINQQQPTIGIPVILQGLELYEYMLVEPCQNLDIKSDKISTTDSITANPPPQRMDDSANLQTSSIVNAHNEETNKAISQGVSSSHSKIIIDQVDVLKRPINQTICPPSFDLLHQFGMDVVEKKQSSVNPNSPVQLVSDSPYAYSKSNLILVVEEGQSMYNQLVNDSRYRKVPLQKPNGMTFIQLHLNMDVISPEKMTENSDGLRTPLLNDGNPSLKSIFVSSPEFWASAAASADAIENTLSSQNSFKTGDVSDVVRRINFFQNNSPGGNSPIVSFMIKQVKERNAEKLVKVFFGVLCAEIIEKCVHRSKFQFVSPELFDDEDSDRTTQVLPDLVKYRDVELHNRMVTVSMNGDFKSHARFFVIAMRIMTHWHFLVWSRAGNKYTHYDSNREIRGAVNVGAAKRTAMWMTKWFQEFLFTDRHSEPEFINSMTYPQEINSKLDGGLYMLHGISCLIDYLHIEDGVFNNISLEDHMKWRKSDVPKIRNCLFRRLSERMEYGDWNEKMENSNARNRRFKRR
ncbi:hypothetical protein ZOSMA_222G00020 [Zostera marina]|uniref:Uncharacterized protein n=1 Tax=Zostera marina TaxID=29655 RepID=A0A0K9PLF1_ZOSMR|nr:hypothetical protein ZOSMA_222G00020 [Zostera marina]